MNKFFSFLMLGLAFSFLAGCSQTAVNEEVVEDANENVEVVENVVSVDDTIIDYIASTEKCSEGEMFVNIAHLSEDVLDNGNITYSLYAKGNGYYVDERGNLSSSCGFSYPLNVEVKEDNGIYVITDYVVPEDGEGYGNSLQSMFTEEVLQKISNEDYSFVNDKSLLEMAEEFYGVTVIPEPKNEFACNFCDKVRYYEQYEGDDRDTNELVFNYVAEDNGENTIYFGNDGSFKAEGSWDAGEGTWYFGNDENTIIVESSAFPTIDRYVVRSVDDSHLNTVLEIIQR